MINFNEETLAKAKQAKSVEELLTLAEENNVDMTAEQAREIFARLNQKSGELSDEELDNVAGGGCHNGEGYLLVTFSYVCDLWTCSKCGGTELINSPKLWAQSKECPNCGTLYYCPGCSYCFSKDGIVLCSNPRNKQ